LGGCTENKKLYIFLLDAWTENKELYIFCCLCEIIVFVFWGEEGRVHESWRLTGYISVIVSPHSAAHKWLCTLEYHDFELYLDKRHWDTALERDSKFEVILTLESFKNIIKNSLKFFMHPQKTFLLFYKNVKMYLP